MKSLKQFQEQINEVLKKSTDISTWISDFVHSNDPKFDGKSKEERIKMAKGAYYAKQKESYAEGLKDACWKGYEAIGTKKKNGKEVPNCVPVKEGKMKDVSMDLDDMDDKEFENKYKKSKQDTKSSLGGKSSPVKKATQSTTVTSKNEELVGKQKNIDVNKNGKIDKDDLSKLRGEGFIDKNVASDLKNLDGASFVKKYNKTKSGYRKMGNVKAEEVSEGLGSSGNTQSVHVTKPTALRIKSYIPPKKLATAPHKDRPVTAAKSVDTGVTATIHAKGKPVTQDKDGKPVTQTMEKRPVTKPIIRSKKDDAMKEAAEPKKAKVDLPFEPDPKPKKQAIAGKSGYGPSVARHLARLGMKGLKKEEVQVDEGKVYDPITKKMVATKPIKVQAGGGATKNGVPVETGPSKYKSKLPMSKAASVLAAEEVETIEEAVTRKHFQQVADLIKSHQDPKKRAELAHFHAGVFKGQNPRFDHNKFMAACDVKEGAMCEEAEQIDELKASTLQSYKDKAQNEIKNRKDSLKYYKAADSKFDGGLKDWKAKIDKRQRGVAAVDKKLTKEEAEQIDELSKDTLNSYVKGAATDLPRYGNTLGRLQTHGKLKDVEKSIGRSINNRHRGIARAVDKLTKEETQVDEAIAKKLPVQHAVDAVHATLGPKSATRFLSHLKPGTDKHTSWDKVNKALTAQGVQTRHIASIAQKTSHMNEETVEESRGHKVLNTFFKNRETAQKAFKGNPAKDAEVAQGGGSPADQGIAAAKADYKKLNKEETMITYKELMAQLAEARYTVQDKREADEIKKASDPLAAYSDKKHPMTASTSNVKKVAGKAYGGSNQKDDDETDEKPEGTEKRGRGRPHGSKSGARRGGSKSEYRGLPTYSLNLPNKK